MLLILLKYWVLISQIVLKNKKKQQIIIVKSLDIPIPIKLVTF